MQYKRVIIKISGETLGGNGETFDRNRVEETARVLKQVAETGVETAVVIGAGNIWRGRQGRDMNASLADQMGMLGTVINCLCMKDALLHLGAKAEVLSGLSMPRVCGEWNVFTAQKLLEEKNILLLAGGTGNPFFSTDTAVVLRALELGADGLLLAKNVDGVYDSDPKINPNARLLPVLSYREAQEKNLKVMDQAAFVLCAENHFPAVRVFGLDTPENILKVLQDDPMGSVLTP